MMFRDRQQAGWQLAKKLGFYRDKKDMLVLAVPRGGAVVASEIAKILNLALDVVCVKKLGASYNEELAIGAVVEDEKFVIWNEELVRPLGVDEEYQEKILSIRHQVLREQIEKFRGGRRLNLKNKNVIIVDDGVATGLTAEAAIKYCRQLITKDHRLILAVPVCARDSYERLKNLVDELVCLDVEENFYAVGQFYEEFGQVSDEEVVELLEVRSRK